MTTTDPVQQAARAAAERLAPTFGPRLQADVEAALYTRGAPSTPPGQFIDPIEVGGLIVAIADLAWSVHTDRKSSDKTPASQDEMTRTIRTTMTETRVLDDVTRQVIEITVEETMRTLT